MGGDWPSSLPCCCWCNFNSRPHAGGDDIVHRHSRGIHISILAPARGATSGVGHPRLLDQFQFPPPRGGRQHRRKAGYEPAISIPAPARGATLRLPISPHSAKFQFPPPRGGRPASAGKITMPCIFQFPPPRGGRRRRRYRPVRSRSISIPAPARGATLVSISPRRYDLFQFPPPRGGRQTKVIKGKKGEPISIPAPARGATDRTGHNLFVHLISIPAPARGATWIFLFRCFRWAISIPAPARGATALLSVSDSSVLFQFPPPRGGRRFPRFRCQPDKDFNSRPRAGGDSKNVQIGLVNFMHLCCILFSQNGKRAVHF